MNFETEKPKIEKMGIGELRHYMCAKSNGNLSVCEKCPGLKGCTVGQRGMVLINASEQKANEIKSADKQEEKSGRQKGLDNAHKALRRKAERYWEVALNQPDPIAYHMQMKNISRVNALTVVCKAKKKYGYLIKAKEQEEEKMQDDEISIAEFLEETEEQPSAETENNAVEEMPVDSDSTVSVTAELSRKYEEISTEKERLMEEIRKKKDLLDIVSEQQEALAMVMNMFK